jgi:hypothetical protein
MENVNEIMSFQKFIEIRYPNYQIDPYNEGEIEALNLWANRSSEFGKKYPKFSLQKGWILTGNVGTGKTDLIKMFQNYLGRYLKSNYKFSLYVAWKLAADFTEKGYSVIGEHEKGNRYYDELCLIDSRNAHPVRETVSHFGNKLLIGEEIIMSRYNSLKDYGYLTHFSTNATTKQLLDIYGERAYSRLTEMCNFMLLTGPDRRETAKSPNVFVDLNSPVKKEVPSTPVSEYEHLQIKANLEQNYTNYLATGVVDKLLAQLDYNVLITYGCDLGGAQELDSLTFATAKTYQKKQSIAGGQSDDDPIVYIEPSQFENEKAKRIHSITEAKAIMVEKFYMELKNIGCKSIFGMVHVNVSELLNMGK